MNTYVNQGPTGTVTVPTLDGQDMTVTYDGSGNWTAETPAGEFEVIATSDGDVIEPADSILVVGPNHHYADFWCDRFADVLSYLARNGSDARTTRHLAA